MKLLRIRVSLQHCPGLMAGEVSEQEENMPTADRRALQVLNVVLTTELPCCVPEIIASLFCALQLKKVTSLIISK